MFVVRSDSPYKTIRDLVGQPVAFGARGSGLRILSRYVLDGIGLKQDEDFKSIYPDRAGDGPAMVQDGWATALWGAGIGWPGFAAGCLGARRRALHRAGRKRDCAHPREAHLPEAVDGACRQLSGPDGGNQLGRFLELCPDACGSDRRRRLSPGAHAAWCRERALQEAPAGLRDDGGKYRRRHAEAGADPSRRERRLASQGSGEPKPLRSSLLGCEQLGRYACVRTRRVAIEVAPRSLASRRLVAAC